MMMFGRGALRRAQAWAFVIGLMSSGAPAPAQLVLGFQDSNAPHIMCKAFISGSNVRMGSGETPNNPEAGNRFGYYAKKYGQETGQQINYDCERYDRITDEWRARWE